MSARNRHAPWFGRRRIGQPATGYIYGVSPTYNPTPWLTMPETEPAKAYLRGTLTDGTLVWPGLVWP